jgi:hypothetical protein
MTARLDDFGNIVINTGAKDSRVRDTGAKTTTM